MRRHWERILALWPDVLPRAVAAGDLPSHLVEKNQVLGSRLNLYGVFRSDLNRWEKDFAERLDNDVSGTVLWWHRNPVRKEWSVSIPVPGQPQFYPDFIVGVAGRATEDHVLLVEVKGQINDPTGNAVAKAQVKHPTYGRALMVHWQDEKEWRTVEYQASSGQNEFDRTFRIEGMKTFG